MASLSVAILGAGAVGSSIAHALAGPDCELCLWSRTPGRAARLRRAVLAREPRARVSATRSPAGLARRLGPGGLVLLCVADGAVAEVARMVASTGGEPGCLLHTNGLLGLDPLEPLVGAGWECGVLHPLVALPPQGPVESDPFAGVSFALAGSRRALDPGRRLARRLGGKAILVRAEPEAFAAYHTAASLLAGGAVVLFDLALGILGSALEEDPEGARRALARLLASVASNLHDLDPKEALTGPASRGAAEVVARQLSVCEGRDPRSAELYRWLTERMLELARARGSIDAAAARRIRRLLSP